MLISSSVKMPVKKLKSNIFTEEQSWDFRAISRVTSTILEANWASGRTSLPSWPPGAPSSPSSSAVRPEPQIRLHGHPNPLSATSPNESSNFVPARTTAPQPSPTKPCTGALRSPSPSRTLYPPTAPRPPSPPSSTRHLPCPKPPLRSTS